jgi:hypothetical protein
MNQSKFLRYGGIALLVFGVAVALFALDWQV